CQHYNDWPYSF
nr:immunoglobulin light chain junction region [Macaca mulatta]MOY14434.1 immunoglobulin light chain junction region [Macaca mulatta]